MEWLQHSNMQENQKAFVNAPILQASDGTYYSSRSSFTEPQKIEFDIAITTTEFEDLKGGAGIFVASFGVGYKAEKAHQEWRLVE